MIRPPPLSTLFPYTTLFRSADVHPGRERVLRGGAARGRSGRCEECAGSRAAPARDSRIAPHLLRLSAGDLARAQGDACRPARPRDPGAARRAAPAVRGVLGGLPDGGSAPRECPEALRGERAAGGKIGRASCRERGKRGGVGGERKKKRERGAR